VSALRPLALLICLAPLAASAGEVIGASPRSMVVEFKLSPYTPSIDTGYAAGKGPYATYFGNSPMLMGELEVEYQFFQKFGSLAIGLSAGYAEKYTRALLTSGAASTQPAGLHLVPLKALLVYRFDWLYSRFDIPLVPYLKAGPLVMPWWMTKGSTTEVVGGKQAAGYKLGVAAVGGLALALDFLDKRLARDFDTSMGVNHTYLFAEITYQNASLFQAATNVKPLDLDSLHGMFGLALEF